MTSCSAGHALDACLPTGCGPGICSAQLLTCTKSGALQKQRVKAATTTVRTSSCLTFKARSILSSSSKLHSSNTVLSSTYFAREEADFSACRLHMSLTGVSITSLAHAMCNAQAKYLNVLGLSLSRSKYSRAIKSSIRFLINRKSGWNIR